MIELATQTGDNMTRNRSIAFALSCTLAALAAGCGGGSGGGGGSRGVCCLLRGKGMGGFASIQRGQQGVNVLILLGTWAHGGMHMAHGCSASI
ncbi:MAG: hypothetical protein ACT6R4_31545 [Variovorax sp.]|uniref:hypothetical protein n=1 Tax=Variovorax sp. TaxID=1871043 RepID=UPI004037E75F